METLRGPGHYLSQTEYLHLAMVHSYLRYQRDFSTFWDALRSGMANEGVFILLGQALTEREHAHRAAVLLRNFGSSVWRESLPQLVPLEGTTPIGTDSVS